MPSNVIYLGLGANLGDRLGNLRAALRALPPEVEIDAVSGLYETAPVGVTDQPNFLNATIAARTSLSPHDLLAHVKRIEWDLGRRPGPVWGPRPIDLDILVYNDELVDQPDLKIPHPRLADRAFVLWPLSELAPNLVVSGLEQTVSSLRSRIDEQGVRRLAAPGWERENEPNPLA